MSDTMDDPRAVNNRPGRLVLAAHPDLGIPALYVHDITGTADAARLLCESPPIHPQTSQIIPRLRQFNPEVASKLIERKDKVKKIPFKLITANQFWVSTDIIGFFAVSYCWHGDEWKTPARFNGDQPNWDFPICPKTLKAILVLFNATCHIAIWLDQICIDQQNLQEKFHTIANLDTIYRNADVVNIFLEDFDITSEEESALYLLHTQMIECDSQRFFQLTDEGVEQKIQNCLNADYGKTLFSVIERIFKSRWFTRAWCRHEFMLSSTSILNIVGRQYASITAKLTVFARIFSLLVKNRVVTNEFHSMPMLQDFSIGISNQERDYTSEGCLFELFVQLQRLACSYERDIISIALNLSGIRLSYVGEIIQQRDCRYILAMIALGAGDASVIGSEGVPIYRLDCPGHQPLIYWPVGEYAINWGESFIKSMPRLCDDTRILYISPERVSLDVFFLLSGPSILPREFKEHVKELTHELISRDIVKEIMGLEIIKCAFALGLSWIDRASEYLAEFLQSTEDDDAIRLAVTRCCLLNEVSTPSQDTLNMRRIAMFIRKLADCCQIIANVKNITALTVSLNSAGTDLAILLVPKHLALSVRSGKYRIAIPAALNNAATLSLRRLWLLEDAKTDQRELALVGRGFYIGDRTLNVEAHDRVSYERSVSIVGEWREESYNERDTYLIIEQLQMEKDNLQVERDDLQVERDSLEKERDSLEKERDSLKKEIDDFWTALKSYAGSAPTQD